MKVTITLPIAILRTVSLALCPLPLAVLLGACALSATSNPARLSTEQEAELIQRLKETEEQDERNAADPSVGTIAGEDFLEHAVEVKGAINELRNGRTFTQTEIDNALESPPKSLSTQQRTEFIQRLEGAEALDDYN